MKRWITLRFKLQRLFTSSSNSSTRCSPVAAVLITDTGAVQRHTPSEPVCSGRAEQAITAFQQLTQIQLQAAAHRANHVWLACRN